MDSEDSRDGSTDNESGDKSAESARSRSVSRSTSRSVSKSLHGEPRSSRSRSSSPEDGKVASSPSILDGDESLPSINKSPNSRTNSPANFETCENGNVGSASERRSQSSSSSSSRSSSPESLVQEPNFPKEEDRNSVRSTDRNSVRSTDRNSVRSTDRNSVRSTDRNSVRSMDRNSVRSTGSQKSERSSKSKSRSRSGSESSRSSVEMKENSDDESSDSSHTSKNSRRKPSMESEINNAEAISDGDMESDDEKPPTPVQKDKPVDINISHEDLSDVSDLEDSITNQSEDPPSKPDTPIEDDDQRRDETDVKKLVETSSRAEDGEEQLDFEAEDGECGEIEDPKAKDEVVQEVLAKPSLEEVEAKEQEEKEKEAQKKLREELEEGEVSDEDDARPEETEPRPVCRFFSKNQCTWGASCRFLHPGVPDKGNYTMFEMIRPLVPGEYERPDRGYGRAEQPVVESAWERGLRTAKEMLRKSIKRKEQDLDFEEKKMNLSLAQEEFDKENGYYARLSPEPRFMRHPPIEFPPATTARPVDEFFNRRQIVYESEFPPRERSERSVRSYRELPSHKMPDFYNNKYEEEQTAAKARKPKREVVIQRVEREERPTRADEWSDPWMRSKSPAGKKTGRKSSYSSGSSYSSSSSTHSTSSRSSYRSRSRSSHRRRSHSRKGRHASPSVIVSERKAANERAAMMNPPAPRKRLPSPSMLRAGAANPPAPPKEEPYGRTRKLAAAVASSLVRSRARKSSRSSSESSGSSSSDSESSASSSSSSRDGSPPAKRGVDLSIVKAMDALKGNSSEKRQIKLNLKTPLGGRKPDLPDLVRKIDATQGKKRPASSPPPSDSKSKKATSRREELLKQLKAVEDAIAKKRSKVN